MENYLIGLDIGTESVGYAVIDSQCKLIKKSGKNLFGVREFDVGLPANATRMYRTSRRRLNRRRIRIELLQEIMKFDIFAIDDLFFNRLNNSFYFEEDKINVSSKNIIFNDENFKDKDYRERYKTIYHLRKELLEDTSKKDIRLVYLAIHHIIKYRGHFLIEGELDAKNSFENEIKNLFIEVYKYYEFSNDDDIETNELSEIIINNINEKTSKKNKIKNINDYVKSLNKDKEFNKIIETIVKLIFGNKGDFKFLYSGILESHSIALNSEASIVEIESIIGDDYYIFENIKNTYSSIMLNNILSDEKLLSNAMVKKYEKHDKDLELLKSLYQEFLPIEKKTLMFRDSKITNTNYYNYIKNPKNSNYEDFGKRIKSDFKDIKDIRLDKIFLEIDENEFLPKQRTTDNIKIPNQLHYNELKIILDNQSKYYSCLKENYDKILSILTFRIPYYVGPLNGNAKAKLYGKKQFNWAVRKVEDVKITPWNFDQVIDRDASAQQFINRMRNKCSYILDEDTLPMNSIYISKFNVFNELNKIRINGKLIDVKDKKIIYEHLFKTTKKVTVKALEKEYTKITGIEVTKSEGYQKADCFASSMSSYIDFCKIVGSIDEQNIAMIEQIIFWLTIFNDKKMIEQNIRNNYGSLLEDYKIKSIVSLVSRYNGWSRLSKKLIDGIYTEVNGQQKTILDILENNDKNFNFMQIINSKDFEFKKLIENLNSNEKDDITIDDINELQCSPVNKKSIWQSVKVVKEIEKIMGYPPACVYIEFARDLDGQNKKERTNSREDFLKKQYDVLIKETSEKEVAKNNKKLIDKKLLTDEMKYLYFLQNGKCLYTGRTLNIDELSYTCHIDHIVPRNLVKDDSIDNKALVLAVENTRKSDSQTLDPKIINSQRIFWKILLESKLMSQKKFYNLTRANFTQKDIEGFVARQLVETRQIIVHTKNLLENYYRARKSGTRVQAVKAGLGSSLRSHTGLLKIRELNSHHHAHDAYICATIGMFIDKKFNYLNDLSTSIKYKNVLQNKGNYIINSFLSDKPIIEKETGEILWDNGMKKLEYMKKIFNYHDLLYSKKVEEVEGEFYNQNLLNKDKGSIPVNKSTIGKTGKYGGYSGQAMSSFMIIRFKESKNVVTRIIGIPVEKNSLIKNNIITEKEFVIGYLKKNSPKADINSVEVLKRFKKYQEIEYNKERLLFASIMESNAVATLHIATDLTLDDKSKKTLYALLNKKAVDRHERKSGITMYSLVSFEDLLDLLDVLIDKSDKLYKIYTSQFEKVKLIDYRALEQTQENREKLEELILMLIKGLKRGAFEETKIFKFDNFEIKLSNFGRINKTFSNVKEDIKLISKSVTGFYQHIEVIRYEF